MKYMKMSKSPVGHVVVGLVAQYSETRLAFISGHKCVKLNKTSC